MRTVPSLHQLSREESLALIAAVQLGRVAVSVDALPAVFPVFMAVVEDRIVFRTVPGTKLAAALNGSIVAIEADRFDEATGAGWSVLVRGIAREVCDEVVADAARGVLMETWLSFGAEHLVEVGTDLVTGRRLA